MKNKNIFLIIVVLVLHGRDVLSDDGGVLFVDYYKDKCPLAEDIVRRNVEIAVRKDPRMAASILRLHFHDCFVMVIYYKYNDILVFSLLVNYLEKVLKC